MKRLKIVLHSKYLFIILIFLLSIYLFFFYLKDRNTKLDLNSNTFTGIITNYKIDKDLLTLEVKGKEKIISYYYFKSEEEMLSFSTNYKLGDTVYLQGTLDIPNNNTIFNQFNYKNYLKHKYIYLIMNSNKITKIKNNTSFLYSIKNNITDYISSFKSKKYLNTFILGNKNTLDSNIISTYQNNGISHLFSISGMHVSLLSGLILIILKKLRVTENKASIIIILFLFFYMFLTDFSPSILRSGLMFSLIALNKIFKLEVKILNLLLFAFIILLFINPYFIFDIGFIYSFTISFYLILIKDKLTNKNYLYSLFIVSLVSFIVSLPITLYYFYEVNYLSIILNLFFVPFISFIIFPLSLIVLFIPFLDNLLIILINILEFLSNLVNNINYFKLVFGRPSFIFIIMYYFFITFYLRKEDRRFLIIIFLLLLILYNDNLVFHKKYIIMIDVGQGDSILYHSNDKTFLIDTGGKINYKKEEWMRDNKTLSDKSLIPLFKSLGIRKINYLILTHGDFDHMGEAINLVNNFKVEKVIFNCGPYNNLEQELIKVLDKKKINYYSCIKELNIDKNKLYFLQTKEYDNENDNSNVIYTELDGYKFMFMGDASSITEREILSKYNLPDIDVLKVGHHGSKTSSSEEFINEINPKYSVISVGKKNRYGHPNKEVLDNLEKSRIYRTDEDGSIMFKIKNNKLKIETCTP